LRYPCTLGVLAFSLVGALAFARPAEAKPRIGLGGGLGDPTGPSLKIFFRPQHAMQVDLGWAPLHHGDGILHASYLFHFKPFVSNGVMDFGLYLGVGAGLAFWAAPGPYFGQHGYGYYGRGRDCYDPPGPDGYDCYYGYGRHGRGGAAMIVRAPVGLFFHWKKVPIDTVVEGGWSPYVIFPDLAHGDFSVKVRYYF
jgi:hypothetical protein